MRIDLQATPGQKAAVLTTAGCAVVFTIGDHLSGSYALDSITMDQIGSVARDAASGLGLPFGQPVFFYPDMSRTPHPFTSEQIQALYKALRDYTAGLTYYAAGQLPSPPTQPITISA